MISISIINHLLINFKPALGLPLSFEGAPTQFRVKDSSHFFYRKEEE